MRNLLFAAVAALALSANVASAQIAITQTAQRADAATFFQSQSNGATSCNTVSETAAQDTITITPPAGQYVYITELYVENTTDATGVTQTETVSTTNIAGGPIFNVGSALTTTQGVAPPQVIVFNPPLKSAAAGVAVTFVPSATQSAHNYLCMDAAGYYGN